MRPDVIVVGAGVIGCSIARMIARAGADVTVIDRSDPGSHASWAAAGMLSPQAEADAPGPFLSLLLEARERFPLISAELREETGIDVGYRTEGTLLVALSGEDEAELEERCRWQRAEGLAVERLTGDEARRLEPALSSEVSLALRFPGDHQVDNRLLSRALWFAAKGAGATFHLGAGVRQVRGEGRIGVELDDGTRIEGGTVVIAAGSWSSSIEGLPEPLPVEPVHGQLIGLRAAPPPVRHVIGSHRGYLVPRSDGRVILGATVERTGFRQATTPEGARTITTAALEMVPALAERSIDAHWSGLRPGTPDGLPILGRDPVVPALVYATGHYRNGILLAPLTGSLIGSLVMGQPLDVDLLPFSLTRFTAR